MQSRLFQRFELMADHPHPPRRLQHRQHLPAQNYLSRHRHHRLVVRQSQLCLNKLLRHLSMLLPPHLHHHHLPQQGLSHLLQQNLRWQSPSLR